MIDIGVERKMAGGKEYLAVLIPTKRKNPLQAQCHLQYVRRDKFVAETKFELLNQKGAKPKSVVEADPEDKACKPKKRPPKKR